MNEPLESRLRQHLASVDAAAVADIPTMTASSRRMADRLRRRHRATACIASVGLISIGAIAVWSNRADAPSIIIASTDGAVSTAATEPVPDGSTTTATSDTPTSIPASSAWADIAPDPRGVAQYPSVVWTGTEALVIGGVDNDRQPVAGAAAYDLAAGVWRRLADPPELSIDPLVAWTGTEMLVIGGTQADGSTVISVGYAYDLASDTWRSIEGVISFVSTTTPSAWTGDELLMWPSGAGQISMAYSPRTDTWRKLADAPVAPRAQGASVWTGTEWVVWGGLTTGTDSPTELADGAAYNPATDTWRLIAKSPLSARKAPGVWTGTEMIVDAGSVGGDRATGNNTMALADGAAYDPATDTWRSLTSGPAHPGFVPVWTGTQMIMFAKDRAFTYDAPTDRWPDDCCGNDEGGGGGATRTAVWTGSTVLLIGSFGAEAGGVTFTPPDPTPVHPTPIQPSTTAAEQPVPSTDAPVSCTDRAAAEPDLDVAEEPDWRGFADYRDWTRDGCLVRIDVLAERPGPEHCGMQSARVIATGSPVGARYTNSSDDMEYVRDPNNVFLLDQIFDADATLPAEAVDTGYRTEDTQLWIVPDDDSSIYLVEADRVERWPSAEPPVCS